MVARIAATQKQVEASVARCLRTPPERCLDAQDFKFPKFRPLTQPEEPEHSCQLPLHRWPDNGGTIPSKSPLFTPSSILFRPRRNPAALDLGGGAGYRP